MSCPCGGGQSCIVDRRNLGAWVFEDDVLKAAGLPLRENCVSEASDEQVAAMKAGWNGYDSIVHSTTTTTTQ